MSSARPRKTPVLNFSNTVGSTSGDGSSESEKTNLSFKLNEETDEPELDSTTRDEAAMVTKNKSPYQLQRPRLWAHRPQIRSRSRATGDVDFSVLSPSSLSRIKKNLFGKDDPGMSIKELNQHFRHTWVSPEDTIRTFINKVKREREEAYELALDSAPSSYRRPTNY